ncbi:MAG: M48 family metalloprotease [Vicinamibacterales bacterium]
MPEALEPVLVYTRIAANMQKTRLLVALFAVVLVPVLSGAAVCAMPLVSLFAGVAAFGVLGPEEIERRLDSITAELDAVRPADGLVTLQDLPSAIMWLAGGLVSAALVMVIVGFAVVTVFLVWRYCSRMVLRAAHARPVGVAEEQGLVRTVENLSIGAGLPMPNLHIVESSSPNTFATGRDPQHASLVVTRGLLTLLERRELQAVIAHELSHIGNHDTRLTTLLAALVGTTSLPLRVCFAPVGFAFRLHPALGVLAGFMAFFVGLQVLAVFWLSLTALGSEEASRLLPGFMWWWAAHGTLTPVYALFVAPVAALFIRQAVSRQREFLADADAVRLTRDPEGLALALAKIGAACGERLRVGEGSVHLYIVDPRGAGSLLHRIFPSHPPLEDRLELLAKMGSGIPRASLETAIEAGRQLRHTASVELASVKVEESSEERAPSSREDEASPAHQPRTAIPVYERPDGWSKVLAELDDRAALTLIGTQGSFVRVVTADNVRGYVSSASLTTLRSVVDRPENQHRD